MLGLFSRIYLYYMSKSIQIYFYIFMARFTAVIHLLMIFINLISLPLVIALEPFYLWMPLITLLVSPLIGGTHCMLNRLENHFRFLAGMPLIHDRLGEFFNIKD